MLAANIPNSKERAPLFQGHTCYPLSPCKDHDKGGGEDGGQNNYHVYYNRGSRDQLNIIYNLLGTPSEAEITKLDKQDARRYVRCFRPRQKLPFPSMSRFQGSSVESLDLLERMLVLDSSERITVDDALRHPLFRNLYSASKVKVAPKKIRLPFEDIQGLSEDQLRLFFLLEVQHFHPSLVLPQELIMKVDV